MQKRLIKAAVLASAMAPAVAQTPLTETPNNPQASTASYFQIKDATSIWMAEHGAQWRTISDKQTGYVRFLHGGHTEGLELAPGESLSDADFASLARVRISEAYGMFGINPDRLTLDKVTFLPLGLIGSSDKSTVRFTQSLNGVNVEGGSVNALFDQTGRLLSLDTIGLPDALLPAETTPTRSVQNAEQLAIDAFTEATSLEALDIQTLGLAIVQEELGALRQGTLAWRVRVGNETEGAAPEAFIYAISARGAARVVKSETQIHYFDVGGTVDINAISGSKATDPVLPLDGAYMTVTSPQAGTTTTDAFGNFNFPGVTGPITATFRFNGTYNDVDNEAGSEYSLTTSLNDGVLNNVLLNPSLSEEVTAQANCFVYINMMRDWTRLVNPSDSSSDFEADANANLNDTCNAYYNGFSTNYFLAGGPCPNTGFSGIIYHEMGHWMNDIYGSGNSSDGFGEGNGDVFAMYQLDDPLVGDGFQGPGTTVRSGLNTRQFCGDANGGCYGEVHADGEVLMGALWKVRARLNTTHGDVVGDLVSNLLFNSWMNAYDDGQIKTIIETHWLTLDDDDGDVGNGSPNYADIDGGFKDQGFPGFKLTLVEIQDVVEPSDTLDTNGPYGVSAVITPKVGNAITSAFLFYEIDGSLPVAVPMTAASNDRFFATIPGQSAPSAVSWWITGTNDLGDTATYPLDAPVTKKRFRIGSLSTYFFDDFEGPNDNGWTHVEIQDQDDWQRDASSGKSGDAPSAYSGTRLWGNDLGPDGWNGEYRPDVENALFSPTIDLTNASGAKLIYRRWLTVEEAIFDQATILVNGQTLWTNPLSGNLIDTQWVEHSLDLSAFDGQFINLEWHLKSDGGLEFGGWNIDDVSVQTLESSPTVGLPISFGVSSPGSTTPSIDTEGQIPFLGNNDFRVTLKNATPETFAYIGLGFNQISTPFFGVILNVSADFLFSGQTDLFGQLSLPLAIPNDPSYVGISVLAQSVFIDAGGSAGIAATEGMQITILP